MTEMSRARWREIYDGGSAEAEDEVFMSLARDILRLQEINRRKAGGDAMRTLHAKIVVGITNAKLVIDDEMPERFQAAHFQPGASLPVTLRLSNASGVVQHDVAPDMRGAALRLTAPDGARHDLLMTSFPVSHARNARQFVAFALLASGERSQMVSQMTELFGEQETERMLANIKQAARPSSSLATERYWSRGAILWGDAGPVRYSLRPTAASLPSSPNGEPNGLRTEFQDRLLRDDVEFRFALQAFVDEDSTPIEDGAIEWTEAASPPVDIATLVIPRQDLRASEAAGLSAVDEIAFNPWNAPADFRPLGNLNRARKAIYAASAAGWLKPRGDDR